MNNDLKILTAVSVLLVMAPAVLFALFVATGFRFTESWDAPVFITSWGFLLGTPAVAGIATLLARRRRRTLVYRINLTMLILWLLALVASLFLHF